MEKKLQDLFDSHGGILKTGELLQKGYYHRKLQELINDGEIEQVRRGYYQCIDDNSYSEVAHHRQTVSRCCPVYGKRTGLLWVHRKDAVCMESRSSGQLFQTAISYFMAGR